MYDLPSGSPRVAIGLAVRILAFCAAAAVLAQARAQAQEGRALERRIIVTQGALPFHDSVANMMARDARNHVALPGWGWNITRKPIRPRPVPGRKPKAMPVGMTMDFFPPPAFRGEAATLDKPGPGAGAPQTIGVAFPGLTLQDEYNLEHFGVIPPDTMGAIGPGHFVEVVNSGIAIYLRGGTRVSYVTIDSFFTIGTSPINGAFDPRVVYDRRSGRFFACALEFGPWVNPSNQSLGTNKGNIILAVSRTSDPTGGWDKYIIPVGVANFFTDFDTMGVDDNGVYFGAHLFPVSTGTDSATIAATAKAPLVAANPSLGAVYAFTGITDMYATPQPAVNLDPVGPAGPAWIVASSTLYYSDVIYRTITWSGGAPSISASTTIPTPSYYFAPNPPALGSSTAIEAGDDRIQNAVIRGGKLWTCRDVGVTSTGGGGSTADRWACEWFALSLSGVTASVSQNGRIYDPSATPRHYYYGSVVATGQGHAALGFSGSNASQYVAAYTAGRLSSDTPGTMEAILLLKAGLAPYQILDGSRNRWGDYSFTSLDPNDDMTIWTIQEYAAAPGANTTNNWGTWIAQLMAPPPTISAASGSAPAGTSGVSLTVTGAGFYDPGAGFAQRLSIQLTGGAPNGISNYAVTYNSPTSATVTFDIAAGASTGTRDLVLTNPDGQSATFPAAFTVTAPQTPSYLWLQNVSAAPGRGIRSWAWLWRSDTWATLPGEPLSLQIDGATVATGVTAADGGMLFTYTVPAGTTLGPHPMTVTFGGDGNIAPTSASATLTVTATSDTTIWIQPSQTAPGQDVIVPAQLQCASDLLPVSGKTLSLKLDGVSAASGVTDANGFAWIHTPIGAGIALGAHTVTVSFAGDSAYNPSSSDGSLTVVGKGDTYLWVGSATGVQGGGVRIWAWLWRTSDWTGLSGKSVVFSVDGSPVQTLTTSIDGGALLFYTIPPNLSLGSHTVTAAFAGDANYNGSNASSTLTVASTTASSVYVQPRTAGLNQPVLLSARLTSASDLSPLAGRSLAFTLDGASVGSSTTGGDGFATLVAPTTGLTAGTHTIGAAFAGGGAYQASSGSATLTINGKGDTYLWVSSVSGAVNQQVHIWAWIWRTSDWSSLSNESIVFKLDGNVIGTVTTNATGGALLVYTIGASLPQGDHTLTASFLGDANYNASSASGTLTVTP